MASAPDPHHVSPRLNAIDAHEHAISLPIREVVRQLADLLGATTVATIGGVGETRAVAGWMGSAARSVQTCCASRCRSRR